MNLCKFNLRPISKNSLIKTFKAFHHYEEVRRHRSGETLLSKICHDSSYGFGLVEVSMLKLTKYNKCLELEDKDG